jgi:hypothetical protein
MLRTLILCPKWKQFRNLFHNHAASAADIFHKDLFDVLSSLLIILVLSYKRTHFFSLCETLSGRKIYTWIIIQKGFLEMPVRISTYYLQVCGQV